MALGAVLAAALTDHGVRTFGLYIAGLDVLKQPGMTGNGYGVEIGTIEVQEQGPGGVSSMRFTIEDPLGQVVLPQDNDPVRYHDIVHDRPVFLGTVQGVDVVVNGVGRSIVVTCQGIEAMLDGFYVPTFSVAVSSFFATAAQSIAAPMPVNAAAQPGSGSGDGTQALPIGGDVADSVLLAGTFSGLTARDQLNALWTIRSVAEDSPEGIHVTIDFYGGLRIWQERESPAPQAPLQCPDDYDVLTINDATGGAIVAANPTYSLDYGQLVHALYVTGAGGTIYGPFSDGTGIAWPIANISDTNIATTAAAQAAALAYMGARGVGVRGQYQLIDFQPGASNYRAGGKTTITDAQVGLVAASFRIFAIAKTYNASGRENWTVSFGGLPPSGTTLIRRLTRGTLS